MNNLIPTRVASIIFALVIAVFGIRNIMQANSMDTIVPDYMPAGGSFWVYFTGICMVLAAIAIVLNNRITKLACYLLALMFIVWKNAIYTGDQDVASSYFKNFNNTISSSQNNNLSLKILYYLDFLKFRKKHV